MHCRRTCSALAVLSVLLAAGIVRGQIAENPDDPSRIAIPHARVRLVHSDDPSQEGTSAWLRQNDPFLLYQTGRDLLHRQFGRSHGVLGAPARERVPLYVGLPPRAAHGLPARFAREHSASCGMCHSSVYREPSAGQTIASTGGLGRNTTHFYGAGLVEMIGERVRREVLAAYDADGDGLIGRAEAEGPRPVRIRPVPGAPEIDFGDLSPGPDGVPRLNTVFRLWYTDAEGRLVPGAISLDDPRVAAFGFAVQPFGWGRGRALIDGREVSQGGEATTLREFYGLAAHDHMGLQAFDPSQIGDQPEAAGLGGLAGVTLDGAQQFDFGGSPDRGLRRNEHGVSLDDPDGDGHLSEVTEGDLDAIEFYLLHTPPPAVLATGESERGRAVLTQVGCTRCHVESWRIPARGETPGATGDRRLFHLETSVEPDEDGVPELVGELVRLDVVGADGRRAPRGDAFTVERVYSDFRHWDIGPAFWERRFDGTLQREHRTAPLWGAGSSAPYGHSGGFMTLHDAIAAHGGAAEAERAAYAALPAAERERLLAYLRSLVLYATDEIPADVDGDGEVAFDFEVAEQEVGYERFDARFLFATAPRFETKGWVTHANGRRVPFAKIVNVAEAYGLELEYRRDASGDGFPDKVLPPEPPVEGAAGEAAAEAAAAPDGEGEGGEADDRSER